MWELDCEESWEPKNWCFWTVVLEKTLESPLDCKEFQPVHFKGDPSWVFIGRTGAEAETPILWPPHAKSWLIGKDPDAGRDLGAGGEGDERGWDGWLASPTWWTWIWVNSGSWWWTGRPGVLWFMGSQRVGHDWATELNWRQHIKKQRHYFANKVPLSQSYGFSRSHIWMWELDYKESLVPKNWCLWTVVLEKTLGSPLDCMEIQPVHPRRDQSWIFIGRTDAEAETPILRPPDVKNWLIWKDPDAGKAWRQEVKGTTEGEMVMASPTQWTWVSVNSGSWWWIGRPGMVQSMGSQRVGHDWATELNTSTLRFNSCVSALLSTMLNSLFVD